MDPFVLHGFLQFGIQETHEAKRFCTFQHHSYPTPSEAVVLFLYIQYRAGWGKRERCGERDGAG